MQEEVKKLMKVNKIIEMEKSKSFAQNNSIDNSQTIFRPSQDNFFPSSRASNQPISRSRINSSKYQPRIKEIIKDKNVEEEVTRLVSHIIRDKNTTISRLESKCKLNQDSTTDLRIQNELESFFLECVETVRKDIFKKQSKMNQQRWDMINFSMFKDLDKIQILGMFTSNEKVMRLIYREMF